MRPEASSDPGDRENRGETGRRPRDPAFDLPIVDPDDEDDELEDLDDDADDDGLDVEDEVLSEGIEEEPRTVLITGACGNTGRKLRPAWTDVSALVPTDQSP